MRLVGCQTWLRSLAVPRRWNYSSYSDANPGLLRHPPFNLASSPHSAAPRHKGGLLIAPRPRMSDGFYSFLSETVPEDSTLVFDGRSRILIPAATVVVTSAEAHHTPRPIATRRQNLAARLVTHARQQASKAKDKDYYNRKEQAQHNRPCKYTMQNRRHELSNPCGFTRFSCQRGTSDDFS